MMRDAILSKDLIFDTGILKNIFSAKSPTREVQFWKSLDERNFFTKKKPFVISSLLLALECLGFTKEQLNPFGIDQTLESQVAKLFTASKNVNPPEIFRLLFELLFKWYQDSPDLKTDALLERCKKEIPFRTLYGQICFRNLFESNLENPSFFSDSLRRLAFDTSLNFDYRGLDLADARIIEIDRYVQSTARSMLLGQYQGYSFARSGDRFVRAAFAAKGMKLDPLYEDEGERVDNEIVHYAVVGCYQSGRHNNVAIFTTERLSSWKRRIVGYFVFLNFLLEGTEFIAYPGMIFQVDGHTGQITDRLDVYDEYRLELRLFRLKQEQGFLQS